LEKVGLLGENAQVFTDKALHCASDSLHCASDSLLANVSVLYSLQLLRITQETARHLDTKKKKTIGV
jgi:hypothetical protein